MKATKPGLAKIQLTTDVVVFTVKDRQLCVLLIRRGDEPYQGSWALPGGFVWEDETTQDTARRILKTKTGVEGVYLEQLFTFDTPERDPRGRVVSVAYFALVPAESLAALSGSAAAQAPAFHEVNHLPRLAFDHQEIASYAARRLRAKLAYTNAAYSLLPEVFTFSQFQELYEIVLGAVFDRRNFRKKILSLGLIEPTNERLEGERHRPAQLYRFVSTQPQELAEPAV